MNYEASVGADGCIFDNSVGSMQRDKGMVSELRLSCLGENCGALGRSYVVDSLLNYIKIALDLFLILYYSNIGND